MLFFCDLSLYMICPYFGWGVYFLFGGLRRDDSNMGAEKHFVYPHLQSMRRNSVADRMTKAIRANIDDERRKKAYTSRSMRKGQMAEARMNRDLDICEEYAHSGHHHPSMNSNAEGYIESNPAITAPGAMAAAGYTNCHMRPSPLGFHGLNDNEVASASVNRLVSELFKNDIPRLQEGGNLRNIILMSAARLVASFNDLLRDVGGSNKVVVEISEAARRAKIDDSSVAPTNSAIPRWRVVLMEWSKQICAKFKEENEQVSRDDPKVNEELLRFMIQRMNSMEASLAEHIERDRNLQATYDEINAQRKELASKDERIRHQEKLIKKLQRMVESAAQPSYSS